MIYSMRSGVLRQGPDRVLAKLRGVFGSPEKRVYQQDGTLVLKTVIRETGEPNIRRGDVRSRVYVMLDGQDRKIAVARPGYAAGEDPAVVGWPICRMPRADHASVELRGEGYTLIMHSSRNYALKDSAGYSVVQIVRRGPAGGWDIEAVGELAPEILCGLFAFCGYMDQENELLIV